MRKQWFADSITQHGLEDRLEGVGVDACPYITPGTRARWEEGWRSREAEQALKERAWDDRTRRLRNTPLPLYTPATIPERKKQKRHPHGSDW